LGNKIKKCNILILILSVVIIVLLLLKYIPRNKEDVIVNKNYVSILAKLTLLGNTNIKNDECGIYNIEDNSLKNNLKVADYISNYIVFNSYYRPLISYSDIECGARGKNICTLSFGGRQEMDKGWSRILSFEYNPKTQTINKNNITCIGL
jgi:hypothetical protein